MTILYLTQAGSIIGGPYFIGSAEVKAITRTGNPEALTTAQLRAVGLVPEVREPLTASQEYGGPVLAANGQSVRLQRVRRPEARTVDILKQTSTRLKTTGGFLPTVPAGNTKWLPSDPATIASLAAYGASASALPAGLDINAMDGTRYALNKSRVTSALDAYAAQMAAIDAVEAAAIVAYRAAPDTFDPAAVGWPAVYVPA